jgi:hypothetical protein
MAKNGELLKSLFELIEAHRNIFKQERIFKRVEALLLAELFVFGRHTITQLLMALGQTQQDWSAWYRLFIKGRFNYNRCCEILFRQTLEHVAEDELYVVAVDSTQTPRSSRKMEGSGWLRNMRTPPFMVGIHAAQRWLNGCWLMPQENGYSRALPLRWLPAFTEKSRPVAHVPMKEWEAAVQFLQWLRQQFAYCGRSLQRVLIVADGSYDTVNLWKQLPAGMILLARSAKNRVLFEMLPMGCHGNRRYGPRSLSPQARWGKRSGWRKLEIAVRGKVRHLQYRVSKPVLRRGAPDVPLFLIIVRGKQHYRDGRRIYRRDPLPFLVNAMQNQQGEWVLPLPVETLLFWAWQRWEIEVCHRELKASFGLGHKQCWNPQAAVLSVQWSAWVYALLLLAGYRAWGLTGGPDVPTRWWRGSGRWSLNTLWRAIRSELWGLQDFHPLCTPTPRDWAEKEALLLALRNAAFAAARA